MLSPVPRNVFLLPSFRRYYKVGFLSLGLILFSFVLFTLFVFLLYFPGLAEMLSKVDMAARQALEAAAVARQAEKKKRLANTN